MSMVLDCTAEQQKFRLTPVDLVESEGTEALLRCEIHNAAGLVQWTKDGFALGFAQSIPGYPRYSVLADSGQGIYNLRIVNVTLEDDAEYQCQVGPYMHHTLIRAKAKLTVIGKCHYHHGEPALFASNFRWPTFYENSVSLFFVRRWYLGKFYSFLDYNMTTTGK
uniref:Ig-like domain-containing protein n=1 Tax=Anopheles culicifacies TaxID=139723 RepID=A0A182MDY1_9DIPT